jgi:CHAT domain-containing protein
MPGHGPNLDQLCRRGWRPRLAICVVALASILSAWSLAGCHASSPQPDARFQSVYDEYLHGNLEAAHTRAEQARKEFSVSKSADSSAWAMKFSLLEGDILLKQGQLADVISLLTCAGALVPTQGDAAVKRNLLCGLAHSRLGQADESARELQTARRLAESTHSTLIAEVLRTEGLVARDAGHLEQATEKFKSSLAAARAGADVLIECADLIDIGFDSMQSQHFTEALTSLQQGADVARSIRARRQLEMAVGNAGWAYMNLGDFEGALAHFQDAERLAREIGVTPHQVVWLQDAGLAQYRLGNLEEARKYDEQALRSASTLPAEDEVDQIANIETNLALLLYEQSQYDTAKRYSDAAVLVARKSKDNIVIAYARFLQGLLASRLTTDKEAESILMSAWQLTPDPDQRAEMESAIARIYSGRQQTEQARLWYRRSIQTFEDKRSTVKNQALRLSTFAYGQAIYRDYADFLVRTNHPIDALQLLDRSHSRTLDEGLDFAGERSPVPDNSVGDPQAVARNLHASILFYSLGPEQSHLWAVTANQTQLFTLPGEKEIQSLVKKHQTDIQQSSDPLRMPSPAAASLYQALIQPAAAMIPAGSKVFIIADGVLHGLNFETLVVPAADGPRYWIEDVAVTTASSIRMLSVSKTVMPMRAAKDLLLIGDPLPPRGDFAPLPDAATEIREVRQHFQPDSQIVLAQAQAIPAAYAASSPGEFRYIHFAAHGTASRLSPLDSAVVLSPPPQDPEGFKLYARDIVQHPLSATLVTISACYGSGVRTYAGEGLVGLAWVFLRAGAHNVIAALWQVADAASPLLMDRLYSELQAGKAPDEALRAAKLSLIHSSRIYRKPLFWGAFQLYAGS